LRVSQPTPHPTATLLQPSLHFSVPCFLALVPLHYPSITLISNTFGVPTPWNASYSHFFPGKTHQATSQPVRLAADLVALRLSAYPHASKIGSVVTQLCYQTSHTVNETRLVSTSSRHPHSCAPSALGATYTYIRPRLLRVLPIGRPYLRAVWLTTQMRLLNLVIESE
jgi:hypothetical protein